DCIHEGGWHFLALWRIPLRPEHLDECRVLGVLRRREIVHLHDVVPAVVAREEGDEKLECVINVLIELCKRQHDLF
ncbi:hypothetical protein PMAYCL1PPCAC_10710, partial [Pristionchus mayeri]